MAYILFHNTKLATAALYGHEPEAIAEDYKAGAKQAEMMQKYKPMSWQYIRKVTNAAGCESQPHGGSRDMKDCRRSGVYVTKNGLMRGRKVDSK